MDMFGYYRRPGCRDQTAGGTPALHRRYILGLETTCDETAAAVVADGRDVLSNVVRSQILLHARYGGVVPEIACRAHLETLNEVVGQALDDANISPHDLSGIAVANGPGLIGCLLIGVSAAKGFAFAWEKPLLAVNHVQAHLYACVLRENALPGARASRAEDRLDDRRLDDREAADAAPTPTFPALGLVISGGHTSLYHMRGFGQLTRIGATTDDAVGEAFDKVAAVLHLPPPGGPSVERLARSGSASAVAFPRALLEKDSLDFSFSGLKTSVLYHVNGRQGRQRDASALTESQKADVAASFQEAATELLMIKCRRAVARYAGAEKVRSLIVGGGVSANGEVRRKSAALAAELALTLHIPAMPFCTDNAAMIAGMGHGHLLGGETAAMDLAAVASI